MDPRTLAVAKELEGRDEALAAAISRVARLQGELEQLRARAEHLVDVLRRAPEEERAAVGSLERAREELGRRRAELARAEAELDEAGRAGGGERAETARRAAERSRERVALAEARLQRGEGALAELRSELESARAEPPFLDDRAGSLSDELGRLPRLSREGAEPPRPGLDGTIEWASRVRAALWVVRSGLETERERVVREANELAAGVLGDPLAATSVAAVRRRLAQAIGDP